MTKVKKVLTKSTEMNYITYIKVVILFNKNVITTNINISIISSNNNNNTNTRTTIQEQQHNLDDDIKN